MGRLITLGCSLMEFAGMKETLSESLNFELVNLSQSAGSNGLQIRRLHSMLLSDDISSNDIVLWQITSLWRNPERIKVTPQVKEYLANSETLTAELYSFVISNDNFDNMPRAEMLCNSKYVAQRDVIARFDPEKELQTLLGTLSLLRASHKKLLVFFGWADATERYESRIKDILQAKQIEFIAQPYVDWAIKNNGTFIYDGMHPDPATSKKFGSEVLMPVIKQLGWA